MKLFWYRREAMMALNQLGYVHFVTKEQCMPDDYKQGLAFYYDEGKREYGKCGIISMEYKDCAANLAHILDLTAEDT